MADLFEEYGESITPKWKKRAEAKEAARAAKPPMVKTGLEKKIEEKNKQLIRYRQWKAEVREGMSRGDYGTEIVDLFRKLRRPSETAGLVEYIHNADWLHRCSLDVRTTLLGYVGAAIIRHRERNGYPPFDDLEPTDDPFCIIRKILTGV